MGNQCGLGLSFLFVTMLLVATISACLAAQNTTVACFEHERLALLKFKHSVRDVSGMLSSWVGNECCRWQRVQCNSVTRNVERLHLRRAPRFVENDLSDDPSNDLFGYHFRASGFIDEDDYLASNELSTSLAELRHLKYLDLSGNDFQGSHIPEFIGSFNQLTYLNLSHAYFSGVIPHHIGNLSNLKILDLNSNPYNQVMEARDMSWISGLSSLEYLDLSSVRLSGAKDINMLFYIFPSLKELRLSICGLTNADLSVFPNSSTIFSNIRHLDLSYNFLKGQFPHFFQNMTSLRFLDLSSFDLSLEWNLVDFLSMIPSLSEFHLSSCNLEEMHLSHHHFNFTTLSNIQHLDLSQNYFIWRFPYILTNMTSLRVLDLSVCSLNSSVPIMPNLQDLDLSINNFAKFADLQIWRQCHLRQLSVRNNEILMDLTNLRTNISGCSQYALEWLDLTSSVKGIIPKSLGRMSNLRGLYLSSGHDEVSNNYLEGTIPESLGKLSLLQVLDLSGNMLTGHIPTFLGPLTELDLSYNYLNGSIPESLGRLRPLQVLDLSSNELVGPIPNFLGKLTKLKLSYNRLNGSIPESFGRLVALTYLFLENNKLTGSIPPSLGRLVSLQSFFVSSNFLSGAIPNSIGKLANLRYLDVSKNSMEGVVFEAHFANLSMLKYLNTASNTKLTFNISHEWLPPFQLIKINLSSCKIANGFPQWLRNQRNFYSVSLSNTTISGPLPNWLRKVSIIPSIDFSHNNLSGPLINLPTKGPYNSTINRNDFAVLFLQGNLFNESIPTSLCKRTDLRYLDLSRNRLSGKIPDCFKNMQELISLTLSSNRLSGVIPSFIGNISSLNMLILNDNNFSGQLPREIWNLRGLMILDLGDNAFHGKIPERIGEKVKSLSVFRLHKNNFTGEIPRSVCMISQLQILDFAHNKFTGTIPYCLGELYAMANNSLALNASVFPDPMEGVMQVMKGITMEYTKTLRFVINIDLSSNQLVGELPVELTALRALVGLNLSNNHLSGGIPVNIGNMKALNSLDLSGNEFSGLIPPSIKALNFLSHLNLSNNNLSGPIPTGNQLQTLIDPSIYIGNKDLCGAPLLKNCSSHEEDPTAMPKNNHEATQESNKVWFYLDITCGFATGFWGVIIVLVSKKQWRHKFFMFAEETVDKIHVAVMVRVNNMKRGREAI
ncbi:hypothetical protein QVD17_34057 [Tagetes erecta]|uniref:Leucine-rich repeat-containing N-terminal plant-type domain-containing protein n=1 Tax=Tagetes erecta TaxID=13708 RepID=A0AAD8JZF3_TARER|nr:hypothetical protein QVD17_34057 [Tagetes erecta]